MTISQDRSAGRGEPGCAWCGRLLPPRPRPGPGRPRRYCRPACRQRAYEARRRLGERTRDEDDLILERAAKEAILDRLAVLRWVVTEVETDGPSGDADVAAQRDALLRAAREALGPLPINRR